MSKAIKRYMNVRESIDEVLGFMPTRKKEVTLPNATLRLGDHARPGSIVPSTKPNTYTREQITTWYDLSCDAIERMVAADGGWSVKSFTFKQSLERTVRVKLKGNTYAVNTQMYGACHLQEAYKRDEREADVAAAVLEGEQVYVNAQPARKDGTLVAHATTYDAYKYILRQEKTRTAWGKDLGANPAYIKGVSLGAKWHEQVGGEGKLEQRVMNNSKLVAKLNKHISIGAPKVKAGAPTMSSISNREAVTMAKENGAPTSVTSGTGCSARSKAFLVNNGLISSE